MNIEIIEKTFDIYLYGFEGKATNGDFAIAGLSLMDRMWQIVKSINLPNKGINYWVYDGDDNMFIGIELLATPHESLGLLGEKVHMEKYLHYKHIGPYNLLGEVYKQLSKEVKVRGLVASSPYLEIYGHWNSDETKLETDILMSLK